MMSRDLRCPEVTRKWRHLFESHLKGDVESRKLTYTVDFTSYKAVARKRRQSHGKKWRHVTSGTGIYSELTSFDRKSPGSGCWKPKTCVCCAFHFLQRCSSQYEAVTRQEMTSCDRRWPEVTRKWRHLTVSHLKVGVECRKLAYTVHFTSCKAVAHSKRPSRNRKWRHMISGELKWPRSDVICPKVTWKGM